MTSLDNDLRLYAVLLKIDKDLAAETREKGCPHCGGVLHSACHPRKLKKPSVPHDGKQIVRFSFCCSADGCRRRITSPSVRFLGRKRYLSVVVVLLGAMCRKLTQRRAEELEKLAGVSRRTLFRWQRWWQEAFPASRFRNNMGIGAVAVFNALTNSPVKLLAATRRDAVVKNLLEHLVLVRIFLCGGSIGPQLRAPPFQELSPTGQPLARRFDG
ncbi:hypothetical protein N9H39_01370 [Gammaproteobacteria bacterium]|nr:hypothetical protein [Gammaproteobacteria bacterium]